MLKLLYSTDFDESFCRIEQSLYEFWQDHSYSDTLFEEIHKRLVLITELPDLFAPYYKDLRRFFVSFHGIQYVVLYSIEGEYLYVVDIVYAHSDYIGSRN